MSVDLFSAISLSVSSAADTAFSASSSGGVAASALTAGMMLSTVCSCLSSVRATSWSPATASQASPPDALPDLDGAASVPEDPLSPQAERLRVRSSNPAVPRVPRARCRMVPAFCVPHRSRRCACLAGPR